MNQISRGACCESAGLLACSHVRLSLCCYEYRLSLGMALRVRECE